MHDHPCMATTLYRVFCKVALGQAGLTLEGIYAWGEFYTQSRLECTRGADYLPVVRRVI